MSGNSGPGGGNPGQSGSSPGQGGGGNPGQGGGGGNDPNVHITVDDQNKTVRAGDWLVSELKAKVHVDPAKVLAEITATALKDLDDGSRINIAEGLRFMSHARGGASS